jgi:hypothetical protein
LAVERSRFAILRWIAHIQDMEKGEVVRNPERLANRFGIEISDPTCA